MECSATFIKKVRRKSALTLVEFLVSIAIGGLLLSALAALTFYTGRSFAALMNYGDLDRHSRNALDQMTYKIRQTDQLTGFSNNQLTFTYLGTNSLSYQYSPTDRTLSETVGGQTKVLLTGCDALNFTAFQRNTASGTYDQFPATLTNNAAKLIQVSWTCSRTVLGAHLNTESVQSAKIVMRNQ